MKCQVHPNCPGAPQVTLIIACAEPHLTETTTCHAHLAVLARLNQEHKLWCHCRLPIITGMYRDKQKIRKLEEEKND
jgi:hypothetical protein